MMSSNDRVWPTACPVCSSIAFNDKTCSRECFDRLGFQLLAAKAVTALREALKQAHHADGCPVRYREDCNCWRREASRIIGE